MAFLKKIRKRNVEECREDDKRHEEHTKEKREVQARLQMLQAEMDIIVRQQKGY
jgi:hypothetical protein